MRPSGDRSTFRDVESQSRCSPFSAGSRSPPRAVCARSFRCSRSGSPDVSHWLTLQPSVSVARRRSCALGARGRDGGRARRRQDPGRRSRARRRWHVRPAGGGVARRVRGARCVADAVGPDRSTRAWHVGAARSRCESEAAADEHRCDARVMRTRSSRSAEDLLALASVVIAILVPIAVLL